MKINRKNLLPIQIIRRITQIAAFALVPGMFIAVYMAIKDIYTAAITGTFGGSSLLSQLMLLGAVILVTVFMGRFFCGFLCAFGSLNDFFWFISQKLFKFRFRVSEKTDRMLKLLKYVLLLFIIVTMWTFTLITISSTANPWTIFGMYASVTGWSDPGYLLSVGGLLLLLIIMGSMFIERFFCRYLCPLGAIFALISRIRLFRIKKPRTECGACKLCSYHCAMGIPLHRTDTISSGECIDCFACIETCPRNNVTANPVPTAAAAAAVITITSLYYAGNLLSQNSMVEAGTAPIAITDSGSAVGQYIDGVYSGSAAGFKGSTVVEVTVENGNITNIDVLATDDDSEFFSRAENTIIGEILTLQSTQVDTVSGATFSSNAIINAVVDALAITESASGSTSVDNATNEDTQAVTESEYPLSREGLGKGVSR